MEEDTQGQVLRGLRRIQAAPFTSLNGAQALELGNCLLGPFQFWSLLSPQKGLHTPSQHLHPYLLFHLSGASALSQSGFFFFFSCFVFTLPLPQVYFQLGHYAAYLLD